MPSALGAARFAQRLEAVGCERHKARTIAESIYEEVALHLQIKARLDAGKLRTVTATIDIARHARRMQAAGHSATQAREIAEALNEVLMPRLGIEAAESSDPEPVGNPHPRPD